ncbi:hypothetical protein DFQ30_001763 [Apophysomyces sp. BC1015]|nr:hypothetical protein DFQ30_001763 [Apophysomyces sp. BC1015]
MQARLNELNEKLRSKSGSEERDRVVFAIGILMRETNDHIDHLKQILFLASDDKEKALRIFTEFKLQLLECHYKHDVQEKIEQVKGKHGLSMEGVVKRPGGFRIVPLDVPLIANVYMKSCCQRVFCIPFNSGYPTYNQLRSKIQDMFQLTSDDFELTCQDIAGGENLLISTAEQYEGAIEKVTMLQTSAALINMLDLHLQTKAEKANSELGSCPNHNFILPIFDPSRANNCIGSFLSPNITLLSEDESANDSEHTLGISTFVTLSQTSNTTSDMKQQKMNDHPLDLIASKVLPRGNYEEIDFRMYHWTVNNWGTREKNILSNLFQAGGFHWKLRLYPKGAIDDDGFSIYLEVEELGKEIKRICTQYAFAISNPNDPTNYYFWNTYDEFCNEHRGWGCSKFYPSEKLNKIHKGKGPFIVDDCCIVSAYVRIIKVQKY